MKMIKVVSTSVYRYEPDWADEVYQANNVNTLADAIALDSKAVNAGEVGLDELSPNFPDVTYEWSIIDE